jgi:SpoVK/Ycf46/Vps4 family AAA+-type ATPase
VDWNLKAWLIQRGEAFTQRARDYGLPVPKGMLVLGVPGTGKSLTAKATASVFGVPLLKLDAGRLFGGLVGQSEANVRSVIQTAEAISPCVLWIDEIEKGFGGVGGSGGSTDGGTSARVFGTMLNWLQDKTHPVFVVATANDVSKLPPEMLRKGRWDELWFVDLPDTRERTAIWDLVIEKYGRDKTAYDTVVLARASELHTGAEIEAAFVEALHRGFAEDREPTELDLGEVLSESVPLAVSMSESIERLRHWGPRAGRGMRRRRTPAISSANWRALTKAGSPPRLVELLLARSRSPSRRRRSLARRGRRRAAPRRRGLRRYEAGEIEDGEYYPAEAVRHRIRHERAKGSRLNPNHTKKRTRPKRDRSDRHSRMREGGPVRENSPPCYGAGFL